MSGYSRDQNKGQLELTVLYALPRQDQTTRLKEVKKKSEISDFASTHF